MIRNGFLVFILVVVVAVSCAYAQEDGEFWGAVRFEWGKDAGPDNVQFLKGDVTCDGADDYVGWRMNHDNPDGPFFEILLVTKHIEGGAGTGAVYAESVSLGFNGSYEQYGLCGTPGKNPPPEVDIDESWAVEDLADFGIDVCPTPIIVVDGMCDSPRFFWTEATGTDQPHLVFFRY